MTEELRTRINQQERLNKNKPRQAKKNKLPGLYATYGSKAHAKKYGTRLLQVNRMSSPQAIKDAITKAFPHNEWVDFYAKTVECLYSDGEFKMALQLSQNTTTISKYAPSCIPYLCYLDRHQEKEFIQGYLGKTV